MNETPIEKPPIPSHRDVADYIGAMARDLSLLARRSEMPVLAYLLDMAQVEASARADALPMEARD